MFGLDGDNLLSDASGSYAESLYPLLDEELGGGSDDDFGSLPTREIDLAGVYMAGPTTKDTAPGSLATPIAAENKANHAQALEASRAALTQQKALIAEQQVQDAQEKVLLQACQAEMQSISEFQRKACRLHHADLEARELFQRAAKVNPTPPARRSSLSR